MLLGDNTSFHNNEVTLRLSVETTLDLALSLLPSRHSFEIYLQLPYTQECYLSLSLKYFVSCWIL